MTTPAPDPGAGAGAGPRDVERWLTARIAAFLGVPAAEVDTDAAVADLGLESVQAVELAEDLAVWIGVTVPETLWWDFPSIRAFSAQIAVDPTTGQRPFEAMDAGSDR